MERPTWRGTDMQLPYRRPMGGWAWRNATLPPAVRNALGDPVFRGYLYGVLGLIALFAVWFFTHTLFFATQPITVSVDTLTWAHGLEVQQWRTVEESDWSVPPKGRELDSYSAVHHYERRLSHYRPVTYSCGTLDFPQNCTRLDPVYVDEPVYHTKYDYEIDKWVHHKWERVRGDHKDRPYWPIPETYREPNPPKIGDVRFNPNEAERERAYAVMVRTGDGMRYPKEVDFETWDTLTLAQELTGHISRRGVLRSVDWSR